MPSIRVIKRLLVNAHARRSNLYREGITSLCIYTLFGFDLVGSRLFLNQKRPGNSVPSCYQISYKYFIKIFPTS